VSIGSIAEFNRHRVGILIDIKFRIERDDVAFGHVLVHTISHRVGCEHQAAENLAVFAADD